MASLGRWTAGKESQVMLGKNSVCWWMDCRYPNMCNLSLRVLKLAKVWASTECTSRHSNGQRTEGSGVGVESVDCCGETWSSSFSTCITWSCESWSSAMTTWRLVLKRLKMGRLPGARLGMPIGNQVNSLMVGWFSRNRACGSLIERVAPDWSDNFSFLRQGSLHSAKLWDLRGNSKD